MKRKRSVGLVLAVWAARFVVYVDEAKIGIMLGFLAPIAALAPASRPPSNDGTPIEAVERPIALRNSLRV